MIEPTVLPRPNKPARSMTTRTTTQRIMLHCTATAEGREVDFDDLYQWHYVDNGWSDVGYHYLIMLGGTIQECRDITKQGAGCSGQNHDTIHITYAGGLEAGTGRSKDTRTQAQIDSTIWLIKKLAEKYDDLDDRRDIVGHNQFAAKDCPCFNVPAWVDDVIEGQEGGGNPEPGMPEVENLVQYIKDLESRITDLETWRRS